MVILIPHLAHKWEESNWRSHRFTKRSHETGEIGIVEASCPEYSTIVSIAFTAQKTLVKKSTRATETGTSSNRRAKNLFERLYSHSSILKTVKNYTKE